MSSTQTGWIRCSPEPTIGVTGARRASFANSGNAPPSPLKTKLGRRITYSSPEPVTACSASHLPLK